MAKTASKNRKSIFFCQQCGYESAKWMGQCPACHEWNSFVEELLPESAKKSASKRGQQTSAALALSEIPLVEEDRVRTGIAELDRVLGGGIVRGSLILIGGDPGIGKSTLLLQVCQKLAGAEAAEGGGVLYVSGEESLQQIKMRAQRMGSFSDRLKILCETDLAAIEEVIVKTTPQLVVIDSIQTMWNEEVTSAPGSVSQVRESTAVLLRIAKTRQVAICIVGHVTKEGNVAGPRVLEHMVDTVLYFEGERKASYRILRAVKNRFGSTDEIGVFEMRQDGLAEVPNPSAFMLEGRPLGASGSVVACSMEGTRPIMIEIQALVCRSNYGFPKRTANGTDYNRVNILMAVLEKRARIPLSQYDAYVNITGGVRMSEPAVDLGILTALLSSHKDLPVPADVVVFGEVGLSGEVRSVAMAEQRIKEAEKLGFKTILLPKGAIKAGTKAAEDAKVRLVPVANVLDVLHFLEKVSLAAE